MRPRLFEKHERLTIRMSAAAIEALIELAERKEKAPAVLAREIIEAEIIPKRKRKIRL